MSRFMDTPCEVKRNVKTGLGQYNQPIYELVSIGIWNVSFDTSRSTNHVIQGEPQPFISERYTVYAPIEADIVEKDLLFINGKKYIANNPLPYRSHLEVNVSIYEEV